MENTRKYITVKCAAGYLAAFLIALLIIAATTLTSYAAAWNDGDTINWRRYKSHDAIHFTTSKGFAGTCCQLGVAAPKSGSAKVTKLSNNSKIAKLVYAYGIQEGWHKNYSAYKSGWDLTKMEMITCLCQASQMGIDNWAKAAEADPGFNNVATLKAEVQKLLNSADDLSKAPDEFEIYHCDNGKSQNFLIWNVLTGKGKLKKEAANSTQAGGRSLAGAVYCIYEDPSCDADSQAEDIDGNLAEFTTKSDGTSNVVNLAVGTYWVKEFIAPIGFAVDENVYTLQIKKGETTTLTVKDEVLPASLTIQKADAESGDPLPQGGGSLAGALIKAEYWGSDGEHWVKGFRTDKYGRITVTGLYAGQLSVWEEEPPEGYEIVNGVATFSVTTDIYGNTIVSAANLPEGFRYNSGQLQLEDPVIRGYIKLTKIRAATAEQMSRIAFVIKSDDTGEAHVVVTDSEGKIDTENLVNSHNTNKNDYVIDKDGNPITTNVNGHDIIDDSKLDASNGIWFGEPKGLKDSAGPLPYGKYTITELPSRANLGKDLLKDVPLNVFQKFGVFGAGYTETLKNDDAKPHYNMYKIRNEDAAADGTGKYGFDPGSFVTYDVVIDHTTIDGKLTLDVSDEFISNPEYFSKPVVLGVKNATQNSISADKNTVNITIAANTRAVVTYGALIKLNAKEYLAAAAKDSDSLKGGIDCNRSDKDNTPDDSDGYVNVARTTNVRFEDPAAPARNQPLDDKEDEAQTPVKLPKLKTVLTDSEGEKIVSGGSLKLVDKISYERLSPGKTYVVEGKLIIKDSKKPMTTGGKELTARSAEFVPKTHSGTVEVEYTIDANEVSGKELVAFETLYKVKEEGGGKPRDDSGKEVDKIEVASHKDIADEDQTVEVPGYEMYKIRNEKASSNGRGKYGFQIGEKVTYNVVIKNTSKTVSLRMDVSDSFVQKPKYFSLPKVKEVQNATQNSISADKNTVNITIAAGETAIVVYETKILEGAKEYLAAAAKDSDSLDKEGNDTNKVYQANKTDDKDGYRNIAKVKNPTPENPKKPGKKYKPLKDKDDEAQTPVRVKKPGRIVIKDKDKFGSPDTGDKAYAIGFAVLLAAAAASLVILIRRKVKSAAEAEKNVE